MNAARSIQSQRRAANLKLAVIFGAVFSAFFLWREIAGTPSASLPLERVVVPRGASVRAAADSLANHNVVASARLFRWYAAIAGHERAIKPGTYQFSPRSSYALVLDAMVSGRSLVHTVVIPEGFDLRDITPLLVRTLGVSADSVLAAASDTAWIRRLDVPVPTLEGYLFPATYSFPDGTTAREAVNAMLEQFEAKWKPEWSARAAEMSHTRHEIMTMASIIEKEARKSEERPLISAVYWNRLAKGMPLQADPTVQFALPEHVDRVLFRDLEIDSKYNTYKYPGLPPGPIASPGIAAIVASLTPANVSYLYFVARPDGGHEFRNSFEEHNKAIGQIKAAKQAEAKSNTRQPRKEPPKLK